MSHKRRLLFSFGCCIITSIFMIVACSKKDTKNASGGKEQDKVIFQCAQNKVITAVFRDDSVSIELSDDRKKGLPQVRSASGARYANKEERFVFWNKGNTAFITEGDSVTYKSCVIQGQSDFTNLAFFQSQQDAIVFRYPKTLYVYRQAVSDTAGWSYASTVKGHLVVQLKSDDNIQPKTNLSAACFSVGWTENPGEVKTCLKLPQGLIAKSDTLIRDGITYRRARYRDAGAGNYYETLQYRTLRDGRCYSLEQMVHSTNIHNYPKERGISEFDSARVWKTLGVPAETFSFTSK